MPEFDELIRTTLAERAGDIDSAPLAPAVRTRTGRRTGVLVGAAAAAMVAVAAPVAVLGGGAPATSVGAVAQPGNPGNPGTERLLRECLGPARAAADRAPLPPDPAGSGVFVTFTDPAGGLAVVGHRAGFGTCDLDRDGQVVRNGLVYSALQAWPGGYDPARQVLSVDLSMSAIAIVGTSTSSPTAPWIYQVVGRAAPQVARVTVTWSNGSTVEAAVGHGVYGARLVVPRDGRPVPDTTVTVRAYDAGGRLLHSRTTDPGTRPTSSPTSPASTGR